MLLKDAASTGIVTVIGAVDSGANLVLSSPGDFVTVVNTGSDWKTMANCSYFSRCVVNCWYWRDDRRN
jgi:hypothetical protein